MKAVCENCCEFIDCVEKDSMKTIYICKKTITYLGRDLYCPKCGEQLYPGIIRDYNLAKIAEQLDENDI